MFRKEKSEDTKFCPFAFNYGKKSGKCIKEECMLWNTEENDCNLNVLVKELKKLKI